MDAVLHPTEIVKNAQSLFLGEVEYSELAERMMCGEVQRSGNVDWLSGLVEIQERRILDLADGRFFCNPLPTWNFVVIIYLGGDKRREIEEVFEIGDLLRLIHGGYDVKVNVTDINGNWATGKTHIDSALATLKKGIYAVLKIIKDTLRVIAKVASMLYDIIKEKIKALFIGLVETIKSIARGLMRAFRDMLVEVAEWIRDGGPRELLKDVVSGVLTFLGMVFKVALMFMGVALAITAAIIAYKVASLGIGAFISSILYQTVLKEILFKMILVGAAIEMFDTIKDLFEKGEEPESGLDKIIGFVGLSGAAVEAIYSIGGTFIDFAEKKIGIIGYYFGIVLAFTGFLAGAATGVLEGKLLKYATIAALITSVIGLVWSLYLLKRDAENKAKEATAPELTLIELAIGACGVVTATINVFDKWGE